VPPDKGAREGDVSATVGTTPFTGADKGTWTAGPITYTTYDRLTSNGTKAISEAECTFSFAGTNSSGATVTGTETVTLSARPTKLQKGASGVLVNGDSASGDYENTLTASASQKLGTA